MSLCKYLFLERQEHRGLLVLAIVALISLPSALGQLIDQTKLHYRMWATYYDWDDMQKSFIWVSEHTPKDATIILPPWRKESYYLTKRATIAQWSLPRFDRMEEWQERIKILVGVYPFDEDSLVKKWSDHYNRLSETQIGGIKSKYGGDYLISEGLYGYPVLFDSGTYKVYSLTINSKQSVKVDAVISSR